MDGFPKCESCDFFLNDKGICTITVCPYRKLEEQKRTVNNMGVEIPVMLPDELPGAKHNEGHDAVNHPAHYTYGKIECIDFILDKGLDFPLGNAVKYIVRAGHKQSADMCIADKQIEDLEKAKQYIEFEIEHLKGLR